MLLADEQPQTSPPNLSVSASRATVAGSETHLRALVRGAGGPAHLPGALVGWLDVRTLAARSAVARAWGVFRLPEARFLADVRRLVLFDVPLFGAAFAVYCARAGSAVIIHPDATFYLPLSSSGKSDGL